MDSWARDFGPDQADLWLENSGAGLELHVRTLSERDASPLIEVALAVGALPTLHRQAPIVAARTSDVSSLLKRVNHEAAGVMGYDVDPIDGAVVLDVRAESEALETVTAALLGLPRRVNVVGTAQDTAVVNGGVALANCTMGFMATYTSGSTTYHGFLTAAHCQTSLRYYYNTAGTGISTAATYRVRTWGANADIAFHSDASKDSASNQFYGSSSSSLTNPGTPQTVAVGATVCRRGKVIGYDCGPVQSITYTPTWTDACNGSSCNAVFVRTTQTTFGGDSGGPVWTGSSTPVGIHKGGAFWGLGYWAVLGLLEARVQAQRGLDQVIRPDYRNVLARVVVCASLALGSGIISRCGLSSEPLPDDVQFASYAPQGTGGNSAALIGVLKVTDGCLVLEQEADSTSVLPLWPDAQVSGSVGDRVELGGGFTENATLATIPPACARLSLPMFLVNS